MLTKGHLSSSDWAVEGTSDNTDTPLEHYNVAKPTSVCVLCYREETTMRSTPTLGPSATKSPVRRKRCNFVSSFSSPERETIREQVSVYVLSFFKRPRGKSSNQTSSSFVEIWPRGLITYIINSKQKEPVSWHLWRQWEEGLLGVGALNVMVNVPV